VAVALQGTLDTFALPDVLRLLAATRKTGRLHVTTGRTAADLWVEDGDVVASGLPADAGADATLVLFELLRSPEGTFEFLAGEETAPSATAGPVEPMLVEAEAMLAEWREIEAVVPSLDAWVSLRDPLPAAEVRVDAELWRAVVAVGHGEPVGAVGRALGLGEIGVSRLVKALVEAGLAIVTPTWAAISDGDDAHNEPFDRDVLLRFLSSAP
jgi:hypothetical protein